MAQIFNFVLTLLISFSPKLWSCDSFPTGIPRTISGPWVISIPYCMPVPCLCNVSPFVLLSFSLDPETDSNSFIIFRHGVIYLWCDRKTLVSSTYWLILTSFSSLMAIPFISGLDLIVSASGSDCIVNKSADIASPCLIPLEMWKYFDKWPLVIIALFENMYIVSIHVIKRSPKLNFRSTSNIHDHSTLSKAFSWSNSKTTESSSFSCTMSSISLMFSPIKRPWIQPLWSVWIISGRTHFILSANVFDSILKSTLRRYIGL